MKQIVDNFPNEYSMRESEHNYSNCPRVYADLKAITNSFEVDMIVCLNRNNIRLGTELDVLKRYRSLVRRTRAEEKEIRTIKAKIAQNGQYKLFSNQATNSKKTKAWHTAFSDSNIALTIEQLEKEKQI